MSHRTEAALSLATILIFDSLYSFISLAGAVGLEPTIPCARNKCLTIWPRANIFLFSVIIYLR